MTKPEISSLRQAFPVLDEAGDDQLRYLIDNCEYFELKQDEFLFRMEEPVRYMHLILDGSLKLFILQNERVREFTTLNKGDITSLLPYSRMVNHVAHAQALEDCLILAFPREKMPEMIRDHYELTSALVHLMSNRIKQFTTSRLQNEKMMALGKLSAGLAHEMNNPAAAIVRSSKELLKHLQQQPDYFKQIMEIDVTPDQVEQISGILFERLKSASEVRMSLMERQGLEDDLTDCLMDYEVDEPEMIAENLVDFHFSCDDLESIRKVTGKDFPAVMHWINQNMTTEKMVKEIEEAATRISGLVASVKNFTHMDRDQEKAKVDLHAGIDNTITMLNHKLKSRGIRVERKYADELPALLGKPGEMNQVWTNILDNAADALEGIINPEVVIETSASEDRVMVKIRDNGPGIPADIVDRIFDPFYTTKEAGKGTGLGLEVVKSIIEGHGGQVQVSSEPGRTEFEIRLPIKK